MLFPKLDGFFFWQEDGDEMVRWVAKRSWMSFVRFFRRALGSQGGDIQVSKTKKW